MVADAKKNAKLDRRHIVNISRTNFALFHSRCGHPGARSRMFDEIPGLGFSSLCALGSADRASGFGPEGRGFESLRARFFNSQFQ